MADDNLISKHRCGSRLVMVAYHEHSHSYFNEDGSGREDGHEVVEATLDTDAVWCRGCGERRELNESDLALVLGEDR